MIVIYNHELNSSLRKPENFLGLSITFALDNKPRIPKLR